MIDDDGVVKFTGLQDGTAKPASGSTSSTPKA